MMSKSASKIRDVRSSTQREMASLKNRRSVSVDTRSRGSYVPDKKRTSSEDRNSGGKVNRKFLGSCTPNARGNSGWGSTRMSINLTDVKRKDARPLSDKAFQKQKVFELVEFLEEIGFNPPISTTKLMAPSKKDFENIFQFLYNYFDPAYQVKKIEEEAPKILKNLGYPFTVNKSAFVYVARTNWPSLLGVLIWLMDLYKFTMKVDIDRMFNTAGDDDKAQIHKILLRYICQSHHSRNDKEKEEEEENVLFTELIKSSMMGNIDELIARNEEKKQRVASVEEEINEFKELKKRNQDLENNIERYQKYISKMQSHYQMKKKIGEQLLEELKGKESESKALEEEISKKQDAYDAQGFDGKKYINYFEAQKKDLIDKLEKKRACVKELEDKFWETQILCTKKSAEATEATESAQKSYNETVNSLRSILDPLSSINNFKVQNLCRNLKWEFPVWEIQFSKHNAESNKAFSNAVERSVETLRSTDGIMKRIYASLDHCLNEIEMKESELSMELKLLSIQENKQEQELDSMRKKAKDVISSLESQYEQVNERIKILKDEESKLEKTYGEMVKEQELLTEFREKKEKELKDYFSHQKEIFEYFEKSEEHAMKTAEMCGQKIVTKLEKLENPGSSSSSSAEVTRLEKLGRPGCSSSSSAEVTRLEKLGKPGSSSSSAE